MIQKPKDFIRERVIGDYAIMLPECPSVNKIDNHDIPQAKQKFCRMEVPKDFKSWTPDARKKFIANEWDKRLNGYWFYNNGNIEYITGLQYFYISYWRINTGYPLFTDADRDFFYVWDMCEKDPLCDGLVYITHRGEGKTYKATCILYEPISRRKNVIATIQSKTEPDARKVFNKLILSWKYLPYFFKPIDTGASRPAKVLEFMEPSTRTSKTQEKTSSDVLNSFLGYLSSGEVAGDGDNHHRVLHDEIGKTVEVDVDERMKVVRETLRAGRGEYGRGKILATTTVEEMEKKGGRNCKKVWDKSNPKKRDENGWTLSGLYRLFKPSDYGYLEIMNGKSFIDEYGYSLRDEAKQFFLNKRAPLKGADLNSEKRKYPLEEKDIWVSDTKKAVYDLQKIEQQKEYNETLGNILVRGNFYWINGVQYGTVGWNPDENGRWFVYWLPPMELRNKTITKNGKKAPANADISCAGLDPYDNNTTTDGRCSDAASYVIRKFDPMNPYETGMFVCEYVNRPKESAIMFEDMIMQSVFYGHEILIESNKIGCINYFILKGYENYLMRRPEETQTTSSRKMVEDFGIPMSGAEARQSLVYATEGYIINRVGLIEEEGREPYMGKCYFDRLLQTWLDYDVDDDWTKYDSMVGAGLALLGARKYITKKIVIKRMNLFPSYKMNGESSERI